MILRRHDTSAVPHKYYRGFHRGDTESAENRRGNWSTNSALLSVLCDSALGTIKTKDTEFLIGSGTSWSPSENQVDWGGAFRKERQFPVNSSVRVAVSQNMWFLETVCEHQLFITEKLMRGSIGDNQTLIKDDGACTKLHDHLEIMCSDDFCSRN